MATQENPEKGTKDWFELIVGLLGRNLLGIEISIYPEDMDVTPRGSVGFLIPIRFGEYPDFYALALSVLPSFRNFFVKARGPVNNLYELAVFDFYGPPFPDLEMVRELAENAGLTFRAKYLNMHFLTSWHRPSVFAEPDRLSD